VVLTCAFDYLGLPDVSQTFAVRRGTRAGHIPPEPVGWGEKRADRDLHNRALGDNASVVSALHRGLSGLRSRSAHAGH
jgi:hypothetical protein